MIEYEPLEIFGCNCCGDLEQTARFTLKPDVVPRLPVNLCATCLDKARALLPASYAAAQQTLAALKAIVELSKDALEDPETAPEDMDRWRSRLASAEQRLAALNAPAEGKENN